MLQNHISPYTVGKYKKIFNLYFTNLKKIIIRKTKRCDFPERSVRFCKTKCILGSTPTLLLISQNRPAYAGNVKRRLNTIQTPFALRFVASLPPMLSR